MKCEHNVDRSESVWCCVCDAAAIGQHMAKWPAGGGGGVGMNKNRLIRVDDIFGHVEMHSRFDPCHCGRLGCGQFINWTVDVDRCGKRTKKPEWVGVRTKCDGTPPKQGLMDRFWAWVGV